MKRIKLRHDGSILDKVKVQSAKIFDMRMECLIDINDRLDMEIQFDNEFLKIKNNKYSENRCNVKP